MLSMSSNGGIRQSLPAKLNLNRSHGSSPILRIEDSPILEAKQSKNPNGNVLKFDSIRERSSSGSGEDVVKLRPVSYKKSVSNISLPSAVDLECQGEEDLWAIWNKLLQNWDTVNAKRKGRSGLEPLIRKGVPSPLRPVVWKQLVQTDTEALTQSYPALINSETPFEKQIIRDSTRTFPNHDMFQAPDSDGLESLRNLMHAYAVYDKEVGYCQGLGFVAGLLLMIMPEEEAFCVFVQILQENNIRDMYKPSMSLLSICNFQLDKLIEEMHPHVYHHLRHQGFTCSLYASTWFLTVFSTMLPLETVFRIMDIYLIEGLNIIFQVALALITIAQSDLMDLDMEGIQHFFTHDLGEKYGKDSDALIKRATGIEIDKRKMKRWEKEYIRKKERELQERKEIIHLKCESKALSERVIQLEKDNSQISAQLVDKQILRAKEAEEMLKLRGELARLKRCSSIGKEEPTKELDFENETICELVQDLAILKVHLADNANKIERLTLELKNQRNENTKLRSVLLESFQELHQYRKNSTSHIGSQLSINSYDDETLYSANDSKMEKLERELSDLKKIDALHVPQLEIESNSQTSSRSSLNEPIDFSNSYTDRTSGNTSKMSSTRRHSRSLQDLNL